ncbi:MAG: phosphoribosylanthranilate isomerase [Bacteroidetes bacterium]|nr:phosphoribosylanthranilate isomerase [Bacteroidota bacterium]
MKIKVCGMKYADNIREVTKLSPDFMGFIFYPKSKRFVADDFVMPEISSSIKKVGVFVNDTIENIFEKVKKYKLDYVQLHGDESEGFCKRAGEKTKVIKAFGIEEQFDFSVLNDYENCCEYFLFDTKTKQYGGSGKSFDRNILQNYKLSKSYFISGGIDSADTGELKPFAIDVNSKFEIKPGLKDINELKKLFDEVHSR